MSEADIAVNNLLRARLGALAPGAGWLSEETEDVCPTARRRCAWIVDPIDGTRAYIAGRADWTHFGGAGRGRPPAACRALRAGDRRDVPRGAAAPAPRSTARRSPRAAAARLTGAKLAGPKRYLDRLAALDPSIAGRSPRCHSLALRLARVAQGELDAAFASPGSHDWDLAAADLLVHEAGGVMTDFAGAAAELQSPAPCMAR